MAGSSARATQKHTKATNHRVCVRVCSLERGWVVSQVLRARACMHTYACAASRQLWRACSRSSAS